MGEASTYSGRQVPRARKQLGQALGLGLPFAGFIVAVVLLWNQAVGTSDLGVFAAFYVAVGMGATVGYHRLLTHRSFATFAPIRYLLAMLGSMAFQGSVIDWVADHRKHHAFADRDGDPHSPQLHDSALASFWHGHAGWLFRTHGAADKRRYAPELLEDPLMVAIDRAFPLFIGLSLGLPALAGWVLTGTAEGALTGFLWGGLVRIFLFHHAIFCVNSVGHFAGRRRFRTADHSVNVAWLAPFSLGEAWHHNHHAFPRSAMHGLRWYEFDIAGLAIRAMERLGLAWNVVRISPERQQERLADA